ncbi:Serine/threonine-protein kinase [Steccherinum ochraceum]|uniref:non-specific serine/threonine protein kinase n=1 Tax=Steccherinum ochraceum TaxID=92696 RepID=A0A4R0R2Q5_9APHY|nr:Serine/threonine-protein kinase [Steccherinum ochraceum]
MEQTIKDPVSIEYATSNAGIMGRAFQDVLPVEVDIPNRESKLLKDVGDRRRAALEDGAALILLALLTANVRTCNLPSSKLRALDVFLALAPHLTDEAKLDRMVPYIVELLQDDSPAVRSAAVRTLMQILILVTVITPSNASIFPEYIIPALSHLVRDPEVSVRCMYAQCVVALADTAVRYLEMGQALRAHGAYTMSTGVVSHGIHGVSEGQEYDEAQFEVSYEASMQELQNAIQEQLTALLVDPAPMVKRAILHNISALCIFLGRQRTNDVLLSHMITYLNDRDWLLRYAFFDCIVDVAACAGGRSLEDYILPLMIQALSDVEETVVAKVLSSLTSLCELGLFQKMRIWELMSATLGFLYHPNIWIRQGAAAFIVSAAKQLPPSDVWCILYPSLKHFLRSEIRDVDEQSLLIALKPSLSRQVFDAAVQWAMKADKTHFWRTHRAPRSESPRDSLAAVRSAGAVSARSRTDEDEANLNKLQQLGMTSGDEAKLTSMRDYILKLARSLSSSASHVSADVDENLRTTTSIELQRLSVVPQTIFLRTPLGDSAPRSNRLVSISRATTDLSLRSPVLGTPRSNRTQSIDPGAGITPAPFEDLRRRLAMINNSGTSLPVSPSAREARSPIIAPVPELISQLALPDAAVLDVPQTMDRPPSPSESLLSVANSSAFRGATQFLHAGPDGQKAAPAIGSSRANAIGVLDAHSKPRSEDGPEASGRSSPVSIAGTIRGSERARVVSLPPISTYDGNEPGISNLLEHLYLDNNRDLQGEFGPPVHEGPVRRRAAGRHSYISRDGSSRRLEANLIAHLGSHSDAVTGLAVSPDHLFFVSASDDKTVKVWDTARLERNVTSKPRHTYGQHHAKVKAVCAIEGTHCFASAADDGSIHVVRVHMSSGQGAGGGLPKYGKLQTVREHRVEKAGEYVTCMTHYMTDTSSNLLYATTHSVIMILELRTMRVFRSMENPRHFGPITAICLDRKRSWVVCGTSTGVVSLWDLRFGILIKSWRAGVASLGRFVRIHQCMIHPTKGRGRWIMVAVESTDTTEPCADAPPQLTTLIEVWDIEKTMLVEVFGTRNAASTSDPVEELQPITSDDAETSPANAIAALVQTKQEGGSTSYEFSPSHRRASLPTGRSSMDGTLPTPTQPLPDIRAFIVGSDLGGHATIPRSAMADHTDNSSASRSSRGYMISGSEDQRLRLWDFGKIERSTILSGPDADGEKPVYSVVRSTAAGTATYAETWNSSNGNSSNRPAQRLSLINQNQHNLMRAHQDTITALLSIESPFRGGISYPGCDHIAAGVKVDEWRMSGSKRTQRVIPSCSSHAVVLFYYDSPYQSAEDFQEYSRNEGRPKSLVGPSSLPGEDSPNAPSPHEVLAMDLMPTHVDGETAVKGQIHNVAVQLFEQQSLSTQEFQDTTCEHLYLALYVIAEKFISDNAYRVRDYRRLAGLPEEASDSLRKTEANILKSLDWMVYRGFASIAVEGRRFLGVTAVGLATKQLELAHQNQVQPTYCIPGLTAPPAPGPPWKRLSYIQYRPIADVCADFLRRKYPTITEDFVQINQFSFSPLSLWIANLLEKTQMRLWVITSALALVQRCTEAQIRMPQGMLGHELFAVACMVANKDIDDFSYSARSWTFAAQHAALLHRMVLLEKALLECLDWKDPTTVWRAGTTVGPPKGTGKPIYRPDLFEVIDSSIDDLQDSLKELSLDISDHPELKFEEHRTHDVLTAYMEKQGFAIKRHYVLETGWEARYTHGTGGRTIGVNSEMDALPGVGHACGHNLIAIAGVAVACALKKVLREKNISGTVILLGTPAEEGGHGKVPMLNEGAYKEMDACLMCHPAPGPPHSGSLSSSLALRQVEAQYHGHTAHAALAPWEGKNAMDAAVAAYNNISLLRQQLKPDNRVHGIISGRDWAVNIIPDYSKLDYIVRSETWAGVEATLPRVLACMEAAATATGCKVEIKETSWCYDLRQNEGLGEEFASVFSSKFGPIDYVFGIRSASTDFGDVTYALPALHPGFGIPTEVNGGNHTRAFAAAARTPEAHLATYNVSKALAAVGIRLLTDDSYFEHVKKTFEEDKALREREKQLV